MKRKLTAAQLEQRRNAAPKGGRATFEKYGEDHMIGMARAMHDKYQMIPCGTNNFAYVDRVTGEIKAFQIRPRDKVELERLTLSVQSKLQEWL